MGKPRQDQFRMPAPKLKPGTKITDVRDPTRFGVIERLTACGYHIHWKTGRDGWMVAGYAREVFLCSDSLTGIFFYLTNKQISAATKAPTPRPKLSDHPPPGGGWKNSDHYGGHFP